MSKSLARLEHMSELFGAKARGVRILSLLDGLQGFFIGGGHDATANWQILLPEFETGSLFSVDIIRLFRSCIMRVLFRNIYIIENIK